MLNVEVRKAKLADILESTAYEDGALELVNTYIKETYPEDVPFTDTAELRPGGRYDGLTMPISKIEHLAEYHELFNIHNGIFSTWQDIDEVLSFCIISEECVNHYASSVELYETALSILSNNKEA